MFKGAMGLPSSRMKETKKKERSGGIHKMVPGHPVRFPKKGEWPGKTLPERIGGS